MLQVFKTLPVVYEIHRAESLPEAVRTYTRDSVTLGWEDRLRGRGRRRSDAGVDFGTALPRGAILRAGDCFVLDVHRLVIEVIEREEMVLVVEPATTEEWGLFGYHIGNSHQPVMMTGRAIVCPDIPGMQQVLDQHGIAFVRAKQRFTPVLAYRPGHAHAGR